MHENRNRIYGDFDKMLNEFDRFFDSLAAGGRYLGSNHHTWTPPTDVYESGGKVVVRIEIAGMRQEDFDVSYDNGLLTVSGTRRDPADKVAWHFLVQAAQCLKDGVPETWTGDTVMITK